MNGLREYLSKVLGIPQDKLLHLICGLGAAQISAGIISHYAPTSIAMCTGFAVSTLAGIGKEIYDDLIKAEAIDKKDIVYTVLGGLLGILFLIPAIF